MVSILCPSCGAEIMLDVGGVKKENVWKNEPASEKQINWLRENAGIDASKMKKGEASKLIDAEIAKRKAAKKQG